MVQAEILRIDDRTLRIENGHVRAFLLEGTRRALLIDSCLTLPRIRTIAESLTDLPVVLANTHADPDHTSGNAAFESFYMHPNEEANYRMHGGVGRIDPVRTGDIIDLGDRRLEVIEAFGHTPGSIMLLDIGSRVLYSGDAIQDSCIFMFGARRNLNMFAESLRSLEKHTSRFDLIFPAHGTIPLDQQIIPKLIRDVQEILSGTVTGTPEIVFGKNVTNYRMSGASFLCDPPIADAL